MTQYNPRYDTKIQPFNIGIIKGWTRSKNLKELKQWLDEGEPHKRLLKEAIYNATIDQWLDGIKTLFEKDWISLDSKIKEVISKIHFCKKDDVWIFARDIVFSDKKLIKKHSFPLFWAAYEEGKKELFDENKVDFSHDEAETTLMYRYISKQQEYLFGRKHENNKGLNSSEEEAMNYLLSKPVYIKPHFFIDNLNNNNMVNYLINVVSKRGNNKLFREQAELFVVACITGVYFQSMINHLIYCGKKDKEINTVKQQQVFMLNLFMNQGVDLEFDFSDKFLEKNRWINYRLEESYGDLAPYSHTRNNYGSLSLKYNHSNSAVVLPESQKVKLAWYWIGGEITSKRNKRSEGYLMTDEDKAYAEEIFEKKLQEC